MQHPRLRRGIVLELDEFLVEEVQPAIQHAAADVAARILRQREAPHDIRRHVRIAVAILPPAPAAVAVLEIVEAVEAGFHHLVQLREIVRGIGRIRPMRRMGNIRQRGRLNSAKQFPGDRLRLQSQIFERLRHDDGGQEPAHRLLRAAVRIIREVRQRIQHRHRDARRDLHVQRRRTFAALLRQIEFQRRRIAPHLARLADELLDAVFVHDELFFHRVHEFSAACFDANANVARHFGFRGPVNAAFAVRSNFDGG